MFILSGGMLKDAKEVARTMLAEGKTEGELEFSPVKNITITTDPTIVGNMVSFDVEGVDFYFGFKPSPKVSAHLVQ